MSILFVWSSSLGNFSKVKKESIEVTKIRLLENEQVIQESEPDFSSNSLIVQTKTIDAVEEEAVSVTAITEDVYLVNFENPFQTENAYEKLKSKSEIKNVIKNYKMHISGVSSGYEAWGVTYTGMDRYTNKLFLDENNEEIKIAVLDTGINPYHEVFMDIEAGDRLDFTDSYDYVNSDDDVTDDNGHGTLVAGAIAESTPANVKIVPVKVMDSEENGDFNDIFEAIADLSTQVDIINLSLGTDSSKIEPDDLISIEEIFEEIVSESGVIIVCAAGNTSTAVEYPAASSFTLAASSIDKNNNFADFSCYGNQIDFATPGVDVVLPSHQSNNGYVIANGTSVSCPFLAASVALVKAENPSYNKDQIIEVLKANSIDLGVAGKDNYYGYGKIDFKSNMFAKSIEVDIENKTVSKATVLFDQNNYSKNNFSVTADIGSFVVQCDKPCLVLSSEDDGESFNVLVANQFWNYTNTYKFDFELNKDLKIVIAIKGDVNLNGTINGRDVTAIKNANKNKGKGLTSLELVLYNVNGVGGINGRDVTLVKNINKNNNYASW